VQRHFEYRDLEINIPRFQHPFNFLITGEMPCTGFAYAYLLVMFGRILHPPCILEEREEEKERGRERRRFLFR